MTEGQLRTADRERLRLDYRLATAVYRAALSHWFDCRPSQSKRVLRGLLAARKKLHEARVALERARKD